MFKLKVKILDWSKTSTKVVFVVFVGLLILSSYFIINSYRDYLGNSEKITLNQLRAISNTLSLNINAREHSYLNKLYNEGKSKEFLLKDSVYNKLHLLFREAYKINELKSHIITLTYDSVGNKFVHILTSNSLPYFGDPYDVVNEKFRSNYNTGGIINKYTDEFGTWLTAFTPILNDKKQAVAIIEVDLQFDEFIKEANIKLYKNLLISVLLFIITTIILLKYIKVVIVSEEEAKYQLEESYKIIHEKNNDIIQSINYAKKIQTAILPPLEIISEHLPESFVLYKPKDIVSGDFYYFHPTEDPNVFFIAVVDCTGHGVPGALMSMIGNDLLKHIINEKKERMPDKILTLLNQGIVEVLKQEGKYQETKDGMDIALCLINKNENKLYYSGANRPLIYFEKNNLFALKPNKMSIGGGSNEKKLFNGEVTSLFGKTFYLHTDGYVDQFGGLNNKKLMTKKFHDLLMEQHEKSFIQQKSILSAFIDKWKGNSEQTDDILVIGFKV